MFSEVINHVVDRSSDTVDPWHINLDMNKTGWNEKINSDNLEMEESGARLDVVPPPVINTLKLENGVKEKVILNGGGGGDGGEEDGGRDGGGGDGGGAEAGGSSVVAGQEGGESVESLDNRHLIKQIGPIRITSKPPDKPTRHRDVIAQVSANIISRPGSPESWGFGVKDPITSAPPRPQSASLLSPPEKRRAPISVDHTLRKHALDFS